MNTRGKKSEGSTRKKSLESGTNRRRFLKRLGWSGIGIFIGGSLISSVRFFYPRVLFEPPSRITIGNPSDYPPGLVSTQFQAKHGIWIVSREDGRLICLRAYCTHLGCTPTWMENQNKFKCPCHGSGFYRDGENFEGPAPRPLDRFLLSVNEDGRLVVDKSVLMKGVANADSDELYPESLLEV